MTTNVTISAQSLEVTIAGISISIDRKDLFDSIETVQAFVLNVWPEKRKQDLQDCGINKVFDKINKYRPLLERALNCYKFDGHATSTITFNEDGTVDLYSNEQNATIDFKGLMQCISDFSDFVEEDEEEAQAEKIATRHIIHFPMGNTFEHLTDMLDTADIYEGNVRDYIRSQNDDVIVSKVDISNLNSLLERAEHYNARIETTSTPEVHDDLIEREESDSVKTYIELGSTVQDLLDSLDKHSLLIGNIPDIFNNQNMGETVSRYFLQTVNTELKNYGYLYKFSI